MRFLFSFLLVFMMLSGSVFSDEGVSEPAPGDTDFGQWENEFKSSLDSLGTAAPAPERESAPAVKTLPPISSQDVLAAKDLPGSDDGARVDRLENTVAQLERTVKALEDRQRILDRTVDDLKRRR